MVVVRPAVVGHGRGQHAMHPVGPLGFPGPAVVVERALLPGVFRGLLHGVPQGAGAEERTPVQVIAAHIVIEGFDHHRGTHPGGDGLDGPAKAIDILTLVHGMPGRILLDPGDGGSVEIWEVSRIFPCSQFLRSLLK